MILAPRSRSALARAGGCRVELSRRHADLSTVGFLPRLRLGCMDGDMLTVAGRSGTGLDGPCHCLQRNGFGVGGPRGRCSAPQLRDLEECSG